MAKPFQALDPSSTVTDVEPTCVHRDRGFFDRLFQSEGNWLAKLSAAGLLGLLVAVENSLLPVEPPIARRAAILLVIPSITIIAAIILMHADSVRGRLTSDIRVRFLPRLFLGLGMLSILVWILAALLLGFPAAILLGSITSGAP